MDIVRNYFSLCKPFFVENGLKSTMHGRYFRAITHYTNLGDSLLSEIFIDILVCYDM